MLITEKPLIVEVTRGGRQEAIHEAHVICCDSSGKIIGQLGNPDIWCYERSLAKPLQLLAAIRHRPSLLDECSHEELAIMSASHNAEEKHIETLRGLMHRYDLDESLLLCGIHPPFIPHVSWEHGRDGITDLPIHHNCSGKHIGMLLACQEQGWPYETYNMPDHPMQVANRILMAKYAGFDPDKLEFGPDGCGVPSWWLSLESIAVASARYADPEFADDELEVRIKDRIFESYHQAAWWTAGTDRFGTPFNAESDGMWLGKIGGEAIFGVSFRNRGIGVAIKIRDGNSRALGPPLLHAMKKWDLINEDQWSRLSDWTRILRKNAPGWEIGWIQVVEE